MRARVFRVRNPVTSPDGCNSAARSGNASSCAVIPVGAWLGSPPIPSAWPMSRLLTVRRERDQSVAVLYRGRHGTAVCGRLLLTVPAHRPLAPAVSFVSINPPLTVHTGCCAPLTRIRSFGPQHTHPYLCCCSDLSSHKLHRHHQATCRESSPMEYLCIF